MSDKGQNVMGVSTNHRGEARGSSRVSPGRIGGSLLATLTFPPILAYEFWHTRSERYRHWLGTLFFVVFGFVMIIEASGDATSHQMAVDMIYTKMSFGLFMEDLWRIVTFQWTESGTKDVFRHIVGYLVGGVLGLPQLFFPVVAGVYGYFFTGSALHVLRHFRFSSVNYIVLAFAGCFLLIRGIDGFFTVRTWTAMWILVYACLKYHENPRLRYLLLMFVPPFVHIGFFILAIPAWVVLVFGSRPMLYVWIFAISSVTNFLPVQDITDQLSRTERGASQVRGYLVEQQRQSSAVEEFFGRAQQTNWYNAYRRSGLPRWSPTVLVVSLLAAGFYFGRMTLYQRRIFSIGLLTLALSNMTWFLFAVHNRGLIVAMIFLFAAFLMVRLDPSTKGNFQNLPPFYKWGVHLSLLLYAPVLVYNLSVISERIGIFLLAMPVLGITHSEFNYSIKAVINMLLGRG